MTAREAAELAKRSSLTVVIKEISQAAALGEFEVSFPWSISTIVLSKLESMGYNCTEKSFQTGHTETTVSWGHHVEI